MKNTTHLHTLLDLLNDMLDEMIEIKNHTSKLNNKLNQQLFRLGKEYDLVNNNLLTTRSMITNRRKLLYLKKSTNELQDTLDSQGSINIIFE
jgi:hypothetical protein